MPGDYLRHALGMLLVGVLIYALMRWGGHYYVEGVGYATIQATLTGQLTGRLASCCCSSSASCSRPRSASAPARRAASSRRRCSWARRWAAPSPAWRPSMFPGLPISVPAFAMVGMGAMVGGGTGAAMTAVAMIFEMTRDYDIVLPMILAVAVGLGVRRMLSRENIYTMKLVRRGHPIPKALHANMFLVRSAGDVMEKDFLLVDEATPLRRVPAPLGRQRAGCATSWSPAAS